MTQRRVAFNTLILTALRFATPALSLVLVSTVSRFLGAEELGRYTLSFAWLALFLAVAPLGLDGLLMREGARDPVTLGVKLGNGCVVAGIASVLVTLLMWWLSWVFPYDVATKRAIVLTSLALPPLTLLSVFEAAFVSLERTEYIAVPRLLEALIKVGLSVGLLAAGFRLEAVLVACLLGSGVAAAVSWRLLRRAHVKIRWEPNWTTIRYLASVSPTFLLIGLAAMLYSRLDVLMLSTFRDLREVGLYGAAYRVLEIARIGPQSLCLAVYPRLASAAVTDSSRARQVGEWTLPYLAAMALPMALGGMVASQTILTVLYGSQFRAGAGILAILLWTVVPYAWVRYHAYVLVAAGRQRVDLLLNIMMLATNAMLNAWLIPRYGATGAALTAAITMSLYALSQYVYVRRHMPNQVARMHGALRPLVAALVMSVGIWGMRTFDLAAQLGGAATLYGGVLLCSGFFGRLGQTPRRMLPERVTDGAKAS